jgi:hypothetical protein
MINSGGRAGVHGCRVPQGVHGPPGRMDMQDTWADNRSVPAEGPVGAVRSAELPFTYQLVARRE